MPNLWIGIDRESPAEKRDFCFLKSYPQLFIFDIVIPTATPQSEHLTHSTSDLDS